MDVDQVSNAKSPPRRNAHEDTESFARTLLKDGNLSQSVFALVDYLRTTIGIVEELDRIEEYGPARDKFEVIVKSIGWYRILYSNAR